MTRHVDHSPALATASCCDANRAASTAPSPLQLPAAIRQRVLDQHALNSARTSAAPEQLEPLAACRQMVAELTGMAQAVVTLPDEARAAVKALQLCHHLCRQEQADTFFIEEHCAPALRDALRVAAEQQGYRLLCGDPDSSLNEHNAQRVFGALLSYPDRSGAIRSLTPLIDQLQQQGIPVCVHADLLSLTLLKSPGELGADMCLGDFEPLAALDRHTQAGAFLATRDGLSSSPREAGLNTSEACLGTPESPAQEVPRLPPGAALALVCAICHGAEGLRAAATDLHRLATLLAEGLDVLGFKRVNRGFFDALTLDLAEGDLEQLRGGLTPAIGLEPLTPTQWCLRLSQGASLRDIWQLLNALAAGRCDAPSLEDLQNLEADIARVGLRGYPNGLARVSDFLVAPTFERYRSEDEVLAYLAPLCDRDRAGA